MRWASSTAWACGSLMGPAAVHCLRRCPANHAVLSQVRTCRQGIVDYFSNFLQLKPYGRIDKCIIRELAPDVAINSGVYTFKLTRDTGEAVLLLAAPDKEPIPHPPSYPSLTLSQPAEQD